MYPIGHDLIGRAWEKNEAYVMSREDYLELFQRAQGASPMQADIVPNSYLVVPIRETNLLHEIQGKTMVAQTLGVIVLYQINATLGLGFQSRQRTEALQYVESVALQLQNIRLRRSQRRTRDYLQLLQNISTSFPSSVMLSELIDTMYYFTTQVVDVSSLLLMLYDRDIEKIFVVFAVKHGTRVDELAEQPVIMQKEECPTWWQVTQVEKRALEFSPAQDIAEASAYAELLDGVWGDQHQAESFLFLPMKMFNRAIGSLAITSTHANAYQPEEIQVLETMLQIVTVNIENAKLYERDRHLLMEARQREAQLAAINSTLQSISSVLNVTELLNNLVESVAQVVNVNVCAFFLLSPDKEELVAQALYAPSHVRMEDDGSGLPAANEVNNPTLHDELIKLIHLPFKGTMLEQMVQESFFYLDAPKLEELAQAGAEGSEIFLQETGVQHMLMIPMNGQDRLVGLLAVSTPDANRFFRPKDVGMLLAIGTQAVSAIRSAQLFEDREEANAELERMNKLKDEFIVTASHELRTPLSAITGYSTLLKRHCQSPRNTPQQTMRFVTKISGAAQQVNDLVDKMTEAAQMGVIDKRLAVGSEPLQVLAAAEIAANMVTLNMNQKIELEVNRDLWVQGDATHFRQILSNLLENASKYSPPQSVISLSASSTTLSQVETYLEEDQIDHLALVEKGNIPVVLVRVKDQGEGVLPQDQRRIFEKFYRAPRSLTTPVRGSGLGLYICRSYIEVMGGKLWLEQSVPGEGSTFSFYLPQVPSPIEEEVEEA
jgi:K+-sensing histidine kinase KdpD